MHCLAYPPWYTGDNGDLDRRCLLGGASYHNVPLCGRALRSSWQVGISCSGGDGLSGCLWPELSMQGGALHTHLCSNQIQSQELVRNVWEPVDEVARNTDQPM